MLGHGPESLIFRVFPQIWCLGWSHGALQGWRAPGGRAGGLGPQTVLTSLSQRRPFSTRSAS